jgi:hypothetical protein
LAQQTKFYTGNSFVSDEEIEKSAEPAIVVLESGFRENREPTETRG